MNHKVILITKHVAFASEPVRKRWVKRFSEKLENFSPIYLNDYLRLRQITKNVNIIGKVENHLFDIFDLLNFCRNDRKYVYDPGDRDDFFSPANINYANGIYLADFLSRQGIEVVYIRNALTDTRELTDALKDGATAVIISLTFLDLDTVKNIGKYIRKVNPEIKIIIGGKPLLLHLDESGNPSKQFVQHLKGYVDYAIFEERGELSLLNLLKSLEGNGDVKGVKNLAYYSNGSVFLNPREKEDGDINTCFPRWDRLSRDITNGIAYTLSSQGCPYQCKFCSFHLLVKGVKYREVDSLREEMRLMAKNGGIETVVFNDDNLAQNSERLGAIARMMIDERFKFRWMGLVRANSITKETAGLMKASGCELVNIGVESGDAKILRNMGKGTSPDMNKRAVDILYESGISVYATFIIGFPGETQETIQNTIDWINSTPVELYKIHLFSWLPLTGIDKERDKYGLTHMGKLEHPVLWKHNTMNAVRASEYFRDIFLSVRNAHTLLFHTSPGVMFPYFYEKGYSTEEVFKMLQVKTNIIRLELDSSFTRNDKSRERDRLLKTLEGMIKREVPEVNELG
jgi:anaerobic magnesium-protoporphyrin IX monomethyl ester cyclase